MRDGSVLSTQSQWGDNSLCVITVQDVKSLRMLGSLTTHKTLKKSHGSGTQLPHSVWKEWEWLTRANNYWRWKLDPFLRVRKKIRERGLEKKREEEVMKKFENKWSTEQVMLTAFSNCCGSVYFEFNPDANKEMWNVTEDTYNLIHLRNAIQSKTRYTRCLYASKRVPTASMLQGDQKVLPTKILKFY